VADHMINAIAAAVRAMEQVVTPNVDPGHPLAREQAELVTGTLRMLITQIPHVRGRQAYELEQNAALAESVADVVGADHRAELATAASEARTLLGDLGPPDAQLAEANRRLTTLLSAAVRHAALTPLSAEAKELGRRVLAGSDAIIRGQRAWFRAQGWGTGDAPDMSELFARPEEKMSR
jgi:hypothetical protein